MPVFTEVKDSGTRQEFSTGSRRDSQDGKARFSLVPSGPLTRLAMHYTNGARKYGDGNWMLGQPASQFIDSMGRHFEAVKLGKLDEDHLAAVAWNAFALMYFQDRDWKAPDGTDLNDMKMMWDQLAPHEMMEERDAQLARANGVIGVTNLEGDTE